MDPDFEYWETGSAATRNYVKYQPAWVNNQAYICTESPNTALVCAVGDVNYDFYLGLATVNAHAKANHLGTQVFNAVQPYSQSPYTAYGGKDMLPTAAYTNRMYYKDESVHMAYLYPTLKAGEIVNLEHVHIFHPNDQEVALKNLENVLIVQPTDVISGDNATLSFTYKNANVAIARVRWYVFATLLGEADAKWHSVKNLRSVLHASNSLYSTTRTTVNTTLYKDGLIHLKLEADTTAPVETYRKSRVVELRNSGPRLCFHEDDRNGHFPLPQGETLTLTLDYCAGADTSATILLVSVFVEGVVSDEVISTMGTTVSAPVLPLQFTVPSARFDVFSVWDIVTIKASAFTNQYESVSNVFAGEIVSRPTSQPSRQPSGQPSKQPVGQPTSQPTRQPSAQPSAQPAGQPTS